MVIEDARVQKLELITVSTTSAILLYEPFVGISALRIFLQHLHVAVRRRVIEIEVILLYIFAMVPFCIVQGKEALL